MCLTFSANCSVCSTGAGVSVNGQGPVIKLACRHLETQIVAIHPNSPVAQLLGNLPSLAYENPESSDLDKLPKLVVGKIKPKNVQASAPAKGKGAKSEATPAQSEVTPSQSEATPAQSEATPAPSETTPAPSETTPATGNGKKLTYASATSVNPPSGEVEPVAPSNTLAFLNAVEELASENIYVVCQYCLQTHFEKLCPHRAKKFCTGCKQYGHMQKECPQFPAECSHPRCKREKHAVQLCPFTRTMKCSNCDCNGHTYGNNPHRKSQKPFCPWCRKCEAETCTGNCKKKA